MLFQIDERLANSSVSLRKIGLFDIRLADDARYYWLIIVPEIAGASEWDDFDEETRRDLIELANSLSRSLKRYANADKMNIASIGNMVAQFHLHIVARHKGDDAWPKPIWGHGTAKPYQPSQKDHIMAALRELIDSFCQPHETR